MKTIKLEDATAPLASYARDIDGEAVVLVDDGKPVAALLPIDNADMETVSLSTNPKFLAIIERARARWRSEGGISTEEMRRRLGLTEE
jgi:antitoxin (DNA-binding transcriptional repressor) of toxin-antitoxin stability system